MNSPLKWLFARRYLVSRKSHSVINIIAAVSVLSVAVSVAAMVILLSVFNGFAEVVQQTYAAVDADMEIRPAGGAAEGGAPAILEANESNRRLLVSVQGVEAVSYVVERQAMLESAGRRMLCLVRGVDEGYGATVPLAGHVVRGDAGVSAGDTDRMLLGDGVAYALGVFSVAGNSVRVWSLGGGRIGSLLPMGGLRSGEFPVCGFFSIDRESDGNMAVIPLRAAQRLFGTGSRADAVAVRVAEGSSAGRVRAAVAASLEATADGGAGVKIVTREEKNSAFYRIMRYEKWGIFFVSALVLAIASLAIVGTVTMLIVEKRGERPVLRSMGAGTGFVRGVFVREGLLIAGAGGLAGLVLGTLLTLAQQHFGIISMPDAGFLVDSYPVKLQAGDIAAVLATFVTVAWCVSMLTVHSMVKSE